MSEEKDLRRIAELESRVLLYENLIDLCRWILPTYGVLCVAAFVAGVLVGLRF